MPAFSAPDGTELTYRVYGEGRPVICLPGGPMQDSEYLGELGGLSAHRQLLMLDPRGIGRSGTPVDRTSYRCDRLVDDVEALRGHLGFDQMDLLAHSAGANLAMLYATRHPQRIGKLVLVTPSTFAVGISITGESRLETARLRRDEPWFGPAYATLRAIVAGDDTDRSWTAIEPFFYGRWDAAAQDHQAAQKGHQNDEAAAAFGADGAYDAAATRRQLATVTAPVLLLAGEVDLNSIPSVVAELADLFPNAQLVVQPGAGHFPWVDDAARFVATTATFLG
jgi:proline iminopeptidase